MDQGTLFDLDSDRHTVVREDQPIQWPAGLEYIGTTYRHHCTKPGCDFICTSPDAAPKHERGEL